MGLPVVPTAAAACILLLAVFKYCIHPAFLSPLSHVPNAHWSAPISSFWILFHRQQQNDTAIIHAAHTRRGPIVRLGPSNISVNSVDGGIRTIYGGGFEKGAWYSNIFSNYGVEPMFAMEAHGPHSKRRRMLSNIYAKSLLQTSPSLKKQTHILLRERLTVRLESEISAGGGAVEMYDIFSATMMDIVSGYIFGLKNCSDMLRDREFGIKLFHDFKSRQKYTFWPQELPGFTRVMEMAGLKGLLVPSWVNTANQDIEAWVMSMCEKAEKTLRGIETCDASDIEDYPTVYAQLRNTLVKDSLKTEKSHENLPIESLVQRLRLNIATELLDHTLAGFDTSGITLTWLTWQLSRPHNLEWQEKLQTEIMALEGSLNAKTIDNLPILHAILMESLRLHAAIPGNQPRVTPSTPTTLGDDPVYGNIPPGTRVQSQAFSLHRNPTVFPDPDHWTPARWLDASGTMPRDDTDMKEMMRWFWAFSSGGRMCIGSNLAMLDMKATIVAIWGGWKTTIADDEGMVANGGYMAEPLGMGPGGKKGVGWGRRFLKCKLERLGK